MSTANYTAFRNEGDEEKPGQGPVVYGMEQPPLPPYTDTPTTIVVTNPTPPSIIRQPTMVPRDYFGLALFVTLCCCLPLGIVALIKSSDVRTRAAIGDQLGAQQASQNARTFSYIGLGIGIASWAVSLVILIIYIAVVVVAVSSLEEVSTQQPFFENIN